MAKVKVILKCRFGNLVPDGKVVEVDAKDAELLLNMGNAVKPKDADEEISPSQAKANEKEIETLKSQLDESITLPKGQAPAGYEKA